MSPLCVSVPPSEVEILTQSGNALEDERYNEGTDLSLACSVLGGNILCIDQINSPQKRSVIETYLLSLRSAHTSSRSNLESANIKIDLQGLSQTPEQGLAITRQSVTKNVFSPLQADPGPASPGSSITRVWPRDTARTWSRRMGTSGRGRIVWPDLICFP